MAGKRRPTQKTSEASKDQPQKRLRSASGSKPVEKEVVPRAPRSHRSAGAPPEAPQPAISGARLTRRRAKDTGAAPVAPEDEPERLLRCATKPSGRAEDKGKQPAMERRPSSGDHAAPPTSEDDARHNTLQGLLRRLGAGLDDMFPGGGGGGGGGGRGGGARLQGILASLRDEDETTVLTGLSELCEHVSISTEDSMLAFPTETVVPLVVALLAREHNPDLMLLAARALTFLADVFPPACSSIIRHGAVPAFCTRLLTIEYIDLAEQSLQALEKLSHDHAPSLLRAGALVAVLSYIDFFQTGVQRVAAATAANICRGLTPEHTDAVSTAAPILIGLLQYQDAKIVDSACLALTRVAEAFSRSPAHMQTLVGFGLINSIVEMVAVSEAGSITSQLSTSTFYGLVKLLTTCAAGSPAVAEALLAAGVSGTLRTLLATSPMLTSVGASPGNVLRSAEQLQDLVALAVQLLPPVPAAAPAAAAPAGAAAAEGGACALSAHLREHPEAARRVAEDLFPAMLRVHAASATPQVKRLCLAALARMLHHTPAPALRPVLSELPVAGLVAALLGSKDAEVAGQGMQAAETLMAKLPDVYTQLFLKEGVVHAMEQLAASAAPADAAAAPAEGVSTRRRSQAAGAPAAPSAAERSAAAAAAAAAAKAPAGDALRSALGVRARSFCARYFIDEHGEPIGCDTQGARALADICARLPDAAAVGDLLRTLGGGGGGESESVSTFELLSSGAVRALRAHLEGADLPPGGADRAWRLLERLGAFADAALPPGSGAAPPAAALVEKLQLALASAEKFAVRLNNVSAAPSLASYYGGYPGGGYQPGRSQGAASGGSLSAGLAALGNPLKIRLAKAADEPALRDYSANVVLIEPLASMAQVEDFLWPRVQPPAAGGGAGAGAGAAGAGAASDPHSRQAQHAQQGAAAAAAAADASTLAGGGAPSGGRPASRGQPIPQPAGGRRLTRAQARAAAEAEVEAQGGEGEGDDGEDDGGDAASEDIADELVIEPGSAGGGAAALAAAAAAEAAGLAGMEGLEEDEDYDEEDDDDDEMGDGYVEGEGDEYDEDDEGMDAAAMHVHDMHLGEEEEAAAAAAAPAAAASPPGPSGRRRRAAKAAATAAAAAAAATAAATAASAARSYASAAAAGAAGTAAAAAPHLVFYMNGRPLPTGSTIFQAVQASVGAGSSGSQAAGADVSSRLWGEVHTLTYRSQAAAAALRAGAGAGAGGGVDEVEVEGPAGGSAAAVTAAAGSPEASPLAELLAPCEVLAGGGGGGGGALEGASADVLDVLSVLRVVEAVNRLAPQLVAALAGRAGAARDASAPPPGHVPRDAFVSGRLGPKLAAQLKDVLSICGGALPPWCGALAARARFLFPFDVRRRYFYCTSFGLPRALHYLQQAHAQEHGPGGAPDRDTGGLRMGRVQRQKVRISRRRLLDSAHKVFELYAAPKSQLEVEFFDEAGTGLGPTLEFYTLLSHELQRRSLGLWRDDGPPPAGRAAKPAAGAAAPPAPRPPARAAAGPGPLRGELARGGGGAPGDEGVRDRDLVAAPLGLFPAPLAPGAGRADAARGPRHFRLLGRVVAKALQDCRLLDLPLAPLLYRLALGRAAGLYDVRAVDAALGATLERLAAAAAAGPAAAVDGCPVADLCLSFVLPGRPDYPLRPGGADVAVTAANLREYVDAVVDATLGSGVAAQVAAFRAGFAAILPPEALAPFYEDEVEAMVCGTGEAWTPEGLAQVVRFDHGYTSSSATAAALLQVLAGLDAVDQRRFVRFVTGTPRLPAGGLAALQPRLTVVRKLSAAAAAELGGSAPGGGGTPRSDPGGALPAGGLGGAVARSAADGDLPSVMTCANYLKLPPYSSVAALRERLLFAIREGQGSFDLS